MPVVEYYLVKTWEAFRPLRDIPSSNFNGSYDETML
jgi:hypothetical protein